MRNCKRSQGQYCSSIETTSRHFQNLHNPVSKCHLKVPTPDFVHWADIASQLKIDGIRKSILREILAPRGAKTVLVGMLC